jgi:hypothetical protein
MKFWGLNIKGIKLCRVILKKKKKKKPLLCALFKIIKNPLTH